GLAGACGEQDGPAVPVGIFGKIGVQLLQLRIRVVGAGSGDIEDPGVFGNLFGEDVKLLDIKSIVVKEGSEQVQVGGLEHFAVAGSDGYQGHFFQVYLIQGAGQGAVHIVIQGCGASLAVLL